MYFELPIYLIARRAKSATVHYKTELKTAAASIKDQDRNAIPPC